MKNNVSLKLALASMKKDKKNYIISFIMMIIAFTFTIAFSTFLSTQEKVDRYQREKDYGDWVVCYQGLNDYSKEFFKSSQLVDKITNLEVIGVLDNNNYIANYNEDYFEIAHITLLEGCLPKNDDEVLVIQHSGYHLDDMIEITIQTSMNQTKQYKVVGIINEYNEKWDTPSVDYFTIDNPSYQTYSYMTSDESVDSFVGFDDGCIYNFSLIARSINYESDNQYDYKNFQLDIGNQSTTTILNIFVVIVGGGLFIAIFFNVNQREKTLFLLRCIGMSKKDMRRYIFYEMIVLVLISMVIAIPLGLLLALFICYLYFLYSGVFIFLSSLMNSIPYLLVIILFVIGCTYFSLLPISIHSLDSLIHKKTRTKLKKYNKAKRMSIFRLSDRITTRHLSDIFLISALIYTQIFCIIHIQSLKDNLNEVSNNQISYQYIYSFQDDELYNNLKGSLNNYDVYKYVECDEERDEYRYRLTIFSLEGLEDRLIDGRLPENKNECLGFYYGESNQYIIGTKVKTSNWYYDDEKQEDIYQSMGEFTVVGTVDLSDRYEFSEENYLYVYLPNSYSGIVVLDEVFAESEWHYKTYIETNKNVFFDLYNKYDENKVVQTGEWSYRINPGLYTSITKNSENVNGYVINELFVYIPMLAICIVFMIFIMRLLIEKMNKDIKLIRCLGMTFKQTIKMYIYLIFEIVIITLCYSYLYLNLYYEEVMIQALYIEINVIGFNILLFALFAYLRTSKELSFYPTDVERFY